MDLENIITNMGKLLNNFKFLPNISEAWGILSFKVGGGYKIIQYLTATALLMIVFLISFLVFGFLNCFGAVSGLTRIGPITIFFFLISIFVVSLIISPFLHGYSIMVYKDIFQNLKSDLSDFFLFIHSFNDNKKVYLMEGFIVSFIVVFLFVVLIFVCLSLFVFISNLLSSLKILVISVLLSWVLKFIVFFSFFSFFFPFFFILMINYVKDRYVILEVREGISRDFNKVISILHKSFRVYFGNFIKVFRVGLLSSFGFITIIGNLLTFPLSFLILAVEVRKYA